MHFGIWALISPLDSVEVNRAEVFFFFLNGEYICKSPKKLTWVHLHVGRDCGWGPLRRCLVTTNREIITTVHSIRRQPSPGPVPVLLTADAWASNPPSVAARGQILRFIACHSSLTRCEAKFRIITKKWKLWQLASLPGQWLENAWDPLWLY